MSSDQTRPGEDALSESERARRELEKRLRAALIDGENPVYDTDEDEDAPEAVVSRRPARPRPARAAPLPLIDPVLVDPEPVGAAPEPVVEPAPVQDAAPETAPVTAEPEPDPAPSAAPVLTLWGRLARIPVDPARMERNLVITANRHDPAHSAFDVLRTRMVQAMNDNGWRRVGITSPTAGCGKSFTAINLAISLSRLDDFRTVLLDMDLHRPGLAKVLGLKDMPATADFLRGTIAAKDYLSTFAPNLLNISDRLALGVNGRSDDFAAELFTNPESEQILRQVQEDLNADIMLFDMPPALAMDDVLALRPHLDCVLIVVGGGQTRARDVREVQRRLGDDLPVLGVVMNKAELDQSSDYSYTY